MAAIKASTQVAGIVLAAGTSTRLERPTPKQLLELGGEALVRRVVRAALASRLEEVIVVLGHAATEVARAVDDLDVQTVENPDYPLGQSTSVRAGLSRVAPECGAALFIPADQPLLSSDLIDRLLVTYRQSGGPIVVPTHSGQRGAPVLFDRSLFIELAQLIGDTGGRSLMTTYRNRIIEVPVDDPLELADVDTVSDLERLAAKAGLAATLGG